VRDSIAATTRSRGRWLTRTQPGSDARGLPYVAKARDRETTAHVGMFTAPTRTHELAERMERSSSSSRYTSINDLSRTFPSVMGRNPEGKMSPFAPRR